MTQQSNTTNWLIHESGGPPQMFKLVQSTGKSIGGIVTSGQPLKIFKAATGQESSQTFSSVGAQQQVLRAIGSTSKLVAKAVSLPVGAMTLSARGTKTIRLTPAQMQNLKLISPQKIQVNQSLTTVPVIQQTHATQKNYISPPILDHSGSRKRQDPLDTEFMPESKRSRKTEKVGKGLRHFSMKVCEKVKKKGTTSYNEVADELVGEFTTSALNSSLADQQYDQKNIRRRVYDALNVLMAMNIISKEKKEIRWIGLPTNSLQECVQLQKEKQKKIESIKEKTKQLQDLIMNQISFKNLTQRNKENERKHGPPLPNSFIQLPFIVVNTNKKTVIDCSISNDKMEYLFQFNDRFEINDDIEVLKSIDMLMGLDKGECTPENLEKLKSLVPKSLEDYVIQLANRSEDHIQQILESAGPGPSVCLGFSDPLSTAEDFVETQLDEENSRQSSFCDPTSPNAPEFTDEDSEDMSSDVE